MFLTSFGRKNLFTIDIYTGIVEKVFDDDFKNSICYIQLSDDGKYIFCLESEQFYPYTCTSYIILDRNNFDIVKLFSTNGYIQ